MKIFINNPIGAELEIKVKSNDTIWVLRKRIFELYRIPVTWYLYSYAEKTLFDDQTLCDCNVQDGSTIYQRPIFRKEPTYQCVEMCDLCRLPSVSGCNTFICDISKKEKIIHVHCADDWIKKGITICPICKCVHDEKSGDSKECDSKECDSKEDATCRICFEFKIDTVIVPCGHLCICTNCADTIKKNGKCPICRAEITSIIKTFATYLLFKSLQVSRAICL